MTQTRSLLEAAEENARHAQERLRLLQERDMRKRNIVRDYDHGNGLSVPKLAEKYGVAAETVRGDLKRAEVYHPQRRASLTPEIRARVLAALRDNPNPADQAIGFGLSASTVRKIGQEAGIFEPSSTRPRRSDADYGELELLDNQLRARWGVGMISLGTGLRSWQQARENGAKPEPETPQAEDNQGDNPW